MRDRLRRIAPTGGETHPSGGETHPQVIDSRSRGYQFGEHLRPAEPARSVGQQVQPPALNPLEAYFDQHTVGPGLWKWRHYFEIYHRHFEKFVGREVHIVEIGVFSGGSLEMWRNYFGTDSRVYGVDVERACRAYEGERVRVFIGDQGDAAFWDDFAHQVPTIDIVIDDGSHVPADQIVTLEALLPRIRPGGVYLCEDIHGPSNEFHDYVDGLSRQLHSMGTGDTPHDRRPTELQRIVQSVHLYPFVAVIELRQVPLQALTAPKHGTEWEPFYDDEPSPAV